MVDPQVRNLARAANFAAFTTMLPSGTPMTHVMWVDADDDYVLINTEVHRTKYENVQANPVVALAIIDASNAYHYADVRGRVVGEVRGPEARAHIDALAQKYTGGEYTGPIQSERVILQIEPERQLVR